MTVINKDYIYEVEMRIYHGDYNWSPDMSSDIFCADVIRDVNPEYVEEFCEDWKLGRGDFYNPEEDEYLRERGYTRDYFVFKYSREDYAKL